MKGINLAQKNGMWKGSKAGLQALHIWVRARLAKPKYCPSCLKVRKLDLANISQRYYRKVSDWEWLCRMCHMAKDGRLARLISRNRAGRLKKRRCASCKMWFKPWNRNGRSCSLSCNAVLANRVRWGK